MVDVVRLCRRRQQSPDSTRPAARVDSSPAIAGGRVFVGSNDGRVYGLDLASGKKVWEYEAASPVTSSPAVAKGKVVVATADVQVHLLRITPNANS